MLSLSVVTPAGVVLEQQVDEVTVPGLLGEFGVLPGHIALIAATRAGVLQYRSGSERGRIAVAAGFAEVDGKDGIVALADKAVRASKIDRAAAETLLQDAEARLGKSADGKGSVTPGQSQAERTVAESDRAWAQAQLDTLRA
jgi:F-type H+-transporting ATPase subunit epsilon